jgi:hypothetical protein
VCVCVCVFVCVCMCVCACVFHDCLLFADDCPAPLAPPCIARWTATDAEAVADAEAVTVEAAAACASPGSG